VAELTLPPEEIEVIREPRVLYPPEGSGMMHRRNVLPSSYPALRRWRMRWHTLTPSELQTLRLLFESTAGGAVSFDWTPPGEAPIRARITSPFVWSATSGQTASVELEILESR